MKLAVQRRRAAWVLITPAVAVLLALNLFPIVYALYNASTYDKRGVGSLISSDAKTMSVTLDFDANGERWRVTRSTSRSK